MSQVKKNDNKMIIMAVAVVAIAVVAGTLLYMNEQKKETVTINLGGKEFSATFEK